MFTSTVLSLQMMSMLAQVRSFAIFNLAPKVSALPAWSGLAISVKEGLQGQDIGSQKLEGTL